jgi:hypothetical protein
MTRAEINELSNEELAALFAQCVYIGAWAITGGTKERCYVEYREHIKELAKKRVLEMLEGGATNGGND